MYLVDDFKLSLLSNEDDRYEIVIKRISHQTAQALIQQSDDLIVSGIRNPLAIPLFKQNLGIYTTVSFSSIDVCSETSVLVMELNEPSNPASTVRYYHIRVK